MPYEASVVHALSDVTNLPPGKAYRQLSVHLARACTDPLPTSFKLAACLYAFGQGGPIKTLADACSIGKSTLRKWLNQFCSAAMTHLRPLYMPAKPFTAEERCAVAGQFASRRGIQDCILACDGSHVPFRPSCKKTALDYKNYKGWTSILSVAFVDSYYHFFDIDVCWPGRAGDNIVLNSSWLMKQRQADPDKRLGPRGSSQKLSTHDFMVNQSDFTAHKFIIYCHMNIHELQIHTNEFASS